MPSVGPPRCRAARQRLFERRGGAGRSRDAWQQPAAGTSASARTPDAEPIPTFRVTNGTVRGPGRITAKLGDTVSFSVTAVTGDTADEVHVHTYDISVALEAGPPRRAWACRHSRVFEMELEESHVRLTQLRVTA